MTTFLNADLPSEDEADESYDPDAEEKRSQGKKSRKNSQAHSRRGLAGPGGINGNSHAKSATEALAEKKRKARASAAYQQLLEASNKRQRRGGLASAVQLSAGNPSFIDSNAVQPVQEGVESSDLIWMRSLGMAPPPRLHGDVSAIAKRILASSMTQLPVTVSATMECPQQSSCDRIGPSAGDVCPVDAAHVTCSPELKTAQLKASPSRDLSNNAEATAASSQQPLAEEAQIGDRAQAAASAAAAAMAAIQSGALRAGAAQRTGMVTVVETRNFAGRHVELQRELKAGSKAAEAAQQRAAAASASGGLDAVLSGIRGPRRANVMDKTSDDWKGYKRTNEVVDDELAAHQKSKETYLGRQAFLKQAELSEYEARQAAKLQADARIRGKP